MDNMYVFALRSELHAVSSLVILSPSDNLVSASQEIFVFLCKNGRKSSEASEHGTLGVMPNLTVAATLNV